MQAFLQLFDFVRIIASILAGMGGRFKRPEWAGFGAGFEGMFGLCASACAGCMFVRVARAGLMPKAGRKMPQSIHPKGTIKAARALPIPAQW